MQKSDFQKGQTVYIYLVGNAARGHKSTEERIQEWIVVSIGRKYITAKPKNGVGWEAKFSIENGFRQDNNGSADYEIYLTEEDLLKTVRRRETAQYVRVNACLDSVLDKLSDMDLENIRMILEKAKTDKK